MTESVEQINTGTPTPQEQTPQYTDIQLRALDMGWKPLSEYDGAEEDFIDAKEFVNRKPLFDKIEHQSKQIKAVTKALEAMKLHYTTVEEASYNRALTNLKAERKQALTDGDGEKFEHIDEQIKNVETQAAALKQAQGTPVVDQTEIHPEFQGFLNRNPWYNTTRYMKEFADETGTRLAASGMSPSDVLKAVEKAVKAEFPHKFVNRNKENAPDVGSSRNNTSRTSTTDTYQLSEQEKRIMDTLVRGGHITKEKYIADLKTAKGV